MVNQPQARAHDFELNLAPIIDCFVTLICFLLLSATYVNLVGLEAKVPIAVPASSPQAKIEPKFKLELVVKGNAVELDATGAGAASGKIADRQRGGQDRLRLRCTPRSSRSRPSGPRSSRSTSSPTSEMKYEDLVRLMDTTRNLDAKDPQFTVTDDRNGKQVKVDTLFPDFVIANLHGGKS